MSTETLLPHEQDRLFLTDSGLETTLIFKEGIELPHFAAVVLMRDAAGRAKLRTYFERHIALAKAAGMGFLLEGPTWRASADWGDKLGLTRRELARLNAESVALMRELKAEHGCAQLPILISGNIGPRRDGYVPGQIMSAGCAQSYHTPQVETLVEAGAEMISAFTMTNDKEAIGIARAAATAGTRAVISFTVETDGRLPTGQTIADAIASVDDATGGSVAYYMINCAHPDHFTQALASGLPWVSRVRGVRANASRRSHQELNDCPDLDDGDPVELAAQYRELLSQLPRLSVLGGCCGTDDRHIACIAAAVTSR